MIPEFPEFKKIELSDKEEVEHITKQFPPYSDFNFVSMWSWDVRGDMRISQLDGNLVVKFSHYLTEESFLSVIGLNNIEDVVKKLISVSQNNFGFGKELKLVPEHVINQLNADNFIITEEPDQFDYIYNLQYISDFSGGHFASKRTAINKLKRNFPSLRMAALDIGDEFTKFNIKKVNLAWLRHKSQKRDPYDEVKNELIAIDRFLSNSSFKNIITLGVFIDNSIVGYHVVEQVGIEYAVCHYIKADFSQSGIYDFMMKETARILLEKGIKYLNFEQDLGLPGLKASKERFSTGIYFRKYRVGL